MPRRAARTDTTARSLTTVARQMGAIVMKMPRRLESPNTWNGRHWRVKHQISQAWEKEIWVNVAQQTGARTIGQVLVCMNGHPDLMRVAHGRKRLTVERQVPSMRNFIRDDDNLRFAVKPLLDALKRQGYIVNDSRKWLQHLTPTQSVSPDGKDWTIVTIEPAVDARDGTRT